MATRIFKGPLVYGEAASTDISSPSSGVGYRDTTLTDAQIQAALKKFDTLAGSAVENEYLFRLSTLVDLIEKTGILGWNAETSYITGSIVVGNDNTVYQAVQSNLNVDPTTDPGTTWINYVTSQTPVVDATETEKGILKLATDQQLIDLTDDTTAITPKKIGDRLLSSTEIAVGSAAGEVDQGDSAIAVGRAAAQLNQGANSVAVGRDAGEQNQGANSVAVGLFAAQLNQGADSVAVGRNAGKVDQGDSAVAVGFDAGFTNQPNDSIAIGSSTSPSSIEEIYIGQSSSTVKIGDGNVQSVSDARDKINITPSNLGLEFVLALDAVSWQTHHRDQNDKTKRLEQGKRPHYGFIAQQVKQVIDDLNVDFAGFRDESIAATPEHKERMQDRLALCYTEFVGPIVKAIQEQNDLIIDLQKQVKELQK